MEGKNNKLSKGQLYQKFRKGFMKTGDDEETINLIDDISERIDKEKEEKKEKSKFKKILEKIGL